MIKCVAPQHIWLRCFAAISVGLGLFLVYVVVRANAHYADGVGGGNGHSGQDRSRFCALQPDRGFRQAASGVQTKFATTIERVDLDQVI